MQFDNAEIHLILPNLIFSKISYKIPPSFFPVPYYYYLKSEYRNHGRIKLSDAHTAYLCATQKKCGFFFFFFFFFFFYNYKHLKTRYLVQKIDLIQVHIEYR